ncbi:MAG: extracellular solute-binding protein, partial [Lachnospiraceae bacterium]|nr:extracellular solute-binding protein [Lachnospiraceae bacterium]
MSLKKRIYAIIILVAVLAGVFYVGKSGIQLSQEEQKESFLKSSKKKDTLQFWYTDEALTDYLNASAVSYYETYGTRVELTLMPQTEVLEAINAATLDDEVQTPDLYMITNDSLEKAYLSGLASEITNTDLLNDAERFAETAKAAVTYKDKMVAYPFYYETCAILYNKTYLEEFAQKQMQAEIDQAAGEASQADAEAGNVEEEGKAQSTDVVFTQEQIAERVKTYMPTTVDTLVAFSDSYDAPENVEGIFKWDVSDILYNYSFAGRDMSIGGINGDDATLVDIYNPSTIKCLTMFQELNQYFFIETKNADYETVIQDFI